MSKINIEINSIKVEVEENTTIIEAAASIGINIPRFCYLKHLAVDGNCRMCTVEVENQRGRALAISCGTNVSEGLKVFTSTDKIVKLRKNILEFLLRDHPIDCPECDQAGECSLQDYYMEHGLYESRLKTSKAIKEKAKKIGKMVYLDQERCIACRRCVRFCRDIAGVEELEIAGRGRSQFVTTFPGKELSNLYSACVADICPVGALTAADSRFACRSWLQESTDSICMECSKACNISVKTYRNKIIRFIPKENMDININWMCDSGRLSYKKYNIESKDTDLSINLKDYKIKLEELKQKIKDTDSSKIFFIANSCRSLEDNAAILSLIGKESISKYYAPPKGESDGFLIQEDRASNRLGLEKLHVDEWDKMIPSNIELVISLDIVNLSLDSGITHYSFNSSLENASFKIPNVYACSGTFVNIDNLYQHSNKCIESFNTRTVSECCGFGSETDVRGFLKTEYLLLFPENV